MINIIILCPPYYTKSRELIGIPEYYAVTGIPYHAYKFII